MDTQFEQRVDELFFDGERTEIRALIEDQREALETIAYPVNWPEPEFFGMTDRHSEYYWNAVRNWMQTTAANALTNAGR